MERRSAWFVTALSVMVGLLLLAPGVAGAAAPPAPTAMERAAATVRPGVFYLETNWTAKVQDHEGEWFGPFQWTSSCSGFGVNPDGYIATAAHCVETQAGGSAWAEAIDMAVQTWIDRGYARESQRGELTDLARTEWKVEGMTSGTPIDAAVTVQQGVAVAGEKSGKAWGARVMSVTPSDKGDVALLKVDQTNLPSLLVAKAEMPVGTDIVSIGYPGSVDKVTDATYEPAFKDGRISAVRTTGGGLYRVYELSAAMSAGMSGGPTVNNNDEVIGVNSFSIAGETEAFNFVAASALVNEMLTKNNVVNRLGPVDESYRAGLTAYYKGDYKTAIKRFDAALAIAPTHEQAQEFRSKAQAAAASSPSGGGSKPWLLLVGLAVLAPIGGGGFLVRRRRSTTPVTPPASAAAASAPAAPAAPESPPVTVAGFCGHCGHAVTPGDGFCPGCGTAVHPEVHDVGADEEHRV